MTELKPGWQRVKFGDVVRQVKDKVDPETSGLTRFVAGEHMDSDDLLIRRWGEIGDGYLGPAFHMRFKPGQVLYGSRRTYLRKVAVPDFEGICANTTFVMESAKPKVLLPVILPFIMTTEAFHKHSHRESKGSVNPYVNFSDLCCYEFPLPPVEEQLRIALLLETAISLVETCRLLTEAACVSRRAWLYSTVNMMMPGQLNTVPLADLLAGSPESGCSAPERDLETGCWVLGLSSLSEHGYVPRAYKAVDPTPSMTSARLSDGDLLIARSNTRERVGFVGRFINDGRQVSFPDTMMRLRPDTSRVSTECLEILLQAPQIRAAIQAAAAGTSASMKKINRKNLQAVCVPDLCHAQQEDLVKNFASLCMAERCAELRLARSRKMYRALAEEALRP